VRIYSFDNSDSIESSIVLYLGSAAPFIPYFWRALVNARRKEEQRKEGLQWPPLPQVVAKAESFAVSSLLSAASLHAAAAHARFPSAGYDRRRRLRREAALHIYIYSKAAPYRRTISQSRRHTSEFYR
jgi:hypothetical protein